MKIVLFNLKYSSNLGDGLIAACLEKAIQEALPGAEAKSIDLAGRQAYAACSGERRATLLRVMKRLPGPVRRAAVRARLQPMLVRLGPVWERELSGANLAIIGGGNLFQDDNLNLPLKLGAAFTACRKAGVPIAVYSVGVTSGWSEPARRLFAGLMDNHVVHVSVRDPASRQAWRTELGADAAPADICPDPGLLAASLIPPIASSCRGRPVIGIGVTHPALLAHHSPDRRVVAGAGRAFLVELALACVERQCDVVFFSNGAWEDQSFLRSVSAERKLSTAAIAGRVRAAHRPTHPEGLLRLLQGFDIVVAHRLHASIAAYALGRPHVGLAWDRKVESFYRSVDRERFLVRGADACPARTAELIIEAYQRGLDDLKISIMISKAMDSVGRLLAPHEVHNCFNSKRKINGMKPSLTSDAHP